MVERLKKQKPQIFLILFFLLLSTINYQPSTAFAAIPKLINYQGRLTDSQGRPITGAKTLKFRLYGQQAGGTMLWEETQSVTIDKGIFNTLLGGVTPLNLAFTDPYYLEIVIEGEVLSPRQQLASSAYALNGVPKGAITMWSGTVSSIPSGWVLCDGSNSTPDLRDKFIVGAKQDDGGVAKTNVTGSLTQSGDGQIPTHSHGAGNLVTNIAGSHTHTYTALYQDPYVDYPPPVEGGGGQEDTVGTFLKVPDLRCGIYYPPQG